VWSPLPARIGKARLVIGGFAVGYLYWQRARFVDEEEFSPALFPSVGRRRDLLDASADVRVEDPGPRPRLSYRAGNGFSSIRLVLGQSF